MVVRVEYDLPTGHAYEGQVIGLPMQSPRGRQFFYWRARPPCLPPLAPALAKFIVYELEAEDERADGPTPAVASDSKRSTVACCVYR